MFRASFDIDTLAAGEGRTEGGAMTSDMTSSYQLAEMYWVSMNSSMPSWPPSRPRPDCLVPPKGAAGSETRPRLRPTMP
jgi:hypothetical protein